MQKRRATHLSANKSLSLLMELCNRIFGVLQPKTRHLRRDQVVLIEGLFAIRFSLLLYSLLA